MYKIQILKMSHFLQLEHLFSGGNSLYHIVQYYTNIDWVENNIDHISPQGMKDIRPKLRGLI